LSPGREHALIYREVSVEGESIWPPSGRPVGASCGKCRNQGKYDHAVV